MKQHWACNQLGAFFFFFLNFISSLILLFLNEEEIVSNLMVKLSYGQIKFLPIADRGIVTLMAYFLSWNKKVYFFNLYEGRLKWELCLQVVFPNLEALELCAISFQKIWQNELGSCFQNLTRLIVRGCHKLKYVFSSSIVKNFSQLQHIEICYCTVLEEIISMEEGPEETPKFVFPRVIFLKLWNLPQLRTFYPALHTSDWPLLKRLEVYGCDKVKIFSKSFSFQRTKKVQPHMLAQHALFLVEKV